ncbi:unnamed protein product [Gongylonema pulchrum]|uniref:Fungal_trans domain-containing protein n=1 Tax=Gongylonema pulchrum TaxID=637853 RepID=A0A183EXS7_9BILA|nr:unnamed protein product [Gongylonema pulchrum]
MRRGTQEDLFEGEPSLPEWLHPDWTCLNRRPGPVDDYTLPSVQRSLPPLLALSTFSFCNSMLSTTEGTRAVFRRLRFLYRQIASSGSLPAMVDLDRSLSYITAFAQNNDLEGDEEALNNIAVEFKFFIVQTGSLSRHCVNDRLFATRNIETNYAFHALLAIWTKALRVSSFPKRFRGFEKLYPMGDASSSAEQLALLLAYGLLSAATCSVRKVASLKCFMN